MYSSSHKDKVHKLMQEFQFQSSDNCFNTYSSYTKPKSSAVDNFSNPVVLAVIAKLQKAEIGLCSFSEPRYLRSWKKK